MSCFNLFHVVSTYAHGLLADCLKAGGGAGGGDARQRAARAGDPIFKNPFPKPLGDPLDRNASHSVLWSSWQIRGLERPFIT